MPTFDLVVLGSGGGPFETNLSGYLLKASDSTWEDGIVALEAGSGLGALNNILKQTPTLFGRPHDSDLLKYTARRLYSYIRGFVITHAHLDHVNGLVLSAGATGASKRIYAPDDILRDISSIFADRLWPNLATWEENKTSHLIYTPLQVDGEYRHIWRDISVRTMPLNHGKNACGVYESVAYFVRHNKTGKEFLFFGDVEPDSIAAAPKTIEVWKAAAPMIPERLSAIFIECSWPDGHADEYLYGHLNPRHLADELTALAREVVKARKKANGSTMNGSNSSPPRKRHRSNPIDAEELRGSLDGLRVYVVHCKDDLEGCYDMPINHTIAGQVRTLVEKRNLGVEILCADQGTRIEI